MQIGISDAPLELSLCGLSKTHDPAKSYGEEVIDLLSVVWENIKSRNIPNTGLNHVAYYENDELFAGIVLTSPGIIPDGLVTRTLSMARYLYYKHTGAYSALPEVHTQIVGEICALSLAQGSPVIEIYGHWNEDASRLETEIIYPLL